jgi:hypothetical protein
MGRPVPVDVLDLSRTRVLVRSLRRIAPGASVAVRLTAGKVVVSVFGQVTQSYLVPLPTGRVGYEVTVAWTSGAAVSALGSTAATLAPAPDTLLLVSEVSQSSEALLAIFDLTV